MSLLHQSVDQISLQEWHDYASGFDERHVFHHRGWIQTLQATYHFPLRIYAMRELETGEILTALPFMRVLSIQGKRKWICLPFTDFFPVFGDIEKTVQMVKYLHETGELKGEIEIRFELPEDQAFHYSTHQVAHHIDLTVDPEKLHENVARNHRKALRQAEKRGMSVEFQTSLEDVQQFFDLQLRTRHAKGLPTQPWAFFKNLHHFLIQDGTNGCIVLAKNKFIVIGGKVVLFWGNTMTGKYSASDYDYLSYRPNHLVYWESLLWGITKGFTVNDLGKTTTDNQGLCRFKRGWTAIEAPLRYTYLGRTTDVEMSEPTESGVMQLASKVIQRSPLFVSRLLGACFYRFLT